MPPITDEGLKAKNSIAQARANLNAGGERKGRTIAPAVSANELVTPTPDINPPAPQIPVPSTRTNDLIGNVATNTQGFIQSQSENAAKEKELAALLGTQTFDAASQRTALNEQYQLPANLARLQDIQTQLASANTASELTKTRIEGAAGQTLGQSGREVTQQDRENAVRTAGLAAEASVLQGNIGTASTLINSAMQDFYQDRQLNNQNMINQLNYYSGKVDNETQQLIDKEKRTYEEDQTNIERALTAVDSAVTSGYATQDDINMMTSLSGDPAAQRSYAQKIVAKARRAEIDSQNYEQALRIQKLQQELAAGNITEDQAKFETITFQNTELLRNLDLITGEPDMVRLLSTGGGIESVGNVIKGAGTGAAAAGTVGMAAGPVGMAVGVIGGGIAGATMAAVAQNKKKETALAAVDFILNSSAFQSIRDQKAAGVTFGQLSNDERVAAARAANALVASVVTDPETKISTGFRGDPASVAKNIEAFQNAVKTNQDRLNKSMLSESANAAIEAVYNEQ